MAKKISTNSWELRRRLAAREPFTTYGALTAYQGAGPHAWSPGQLPEPWRTQYLAAWRDNAIAYAVLSYETPIAWVTVPVSDGTPVPPDTYGHAIVTPDVKYSRTTTRHQGLLYALRQPADGALAEAAVRERQTAAQRVAELHRDAQTRARVDAIRSDLRDRRDALRLLRGGYVAAHTAPVPDGAIYSDEYLSRHYGPRA